MSNRQPFVIDAPPRRCLQWKASNVFELRGVRRWSVVGGSWLAVSKRGKNYFACSAKAVTMSETSERYRKFPNGRSTTMSYDGDGLEVKTANTTGLPNPTFKVRSSLLGGQVLTEVFQTTLQKTKGYFYASGNKIAEFIPSTGVRWEHTSPHTIREFKSDINGTTSGRVELDPLGSSVGTADPYPDPLAHDHIAPFPNRGDGIDFSSGCTWEGSALDCAVFNEISNVVFGKRELPHASQHGPTFHHLPWYSMNAFGHYRDPDDIAFVDNVSSIDDILYDLKTKTDEIDGDDWWERNLIRGEASGGHFARPQDRLKPKTKGNFTPEQLKRLNDAFELLLTLLENEECANIFGGEDKVLKLLKETEFSIKEGLAPQFGDDKRPSHAQDEITHAGTDGKKVFLNSKGGFFAKDGKVKAQIGGDAFVPKFSTPTKDYRVANDVKFAAFILLHELGHRAKIYPKKDDDDDSLDKTKRNNEKVVKCITDK
jgi:hypothetical protein